MKFSIQDLEDLCCSLYASMDLTKSNEDKDKERFIRYASLSNRIIDSIHDSEVAKVVAEMQFQHLNTKDV